MSLRWSRPSLSRLRGGTHPLADRPCEPRPLDQDGRIRRLHRWMPGKFLGPGRQIDSQDNQTSVSRFAGQTETQDSRPYASTGSPAGMVVTSTTSFSMPVRHSDEDPETLVRRVVMAGRHSVVGSAPIW